jgi:hypothetical protein
MQGETAETLHCVDCGKTASRASVTLHSGAVSAPSDEGHVRHTRIALCDACADRRVAVQEPNFV